MLTGLCHPVRVGPEDTTPLGFGRHPSSWPGPSSPAEGHICVSQGVMVLSGPGVLSEDPPGPVRESREVLTILPNRSGGRGSKALLGLSCGGSLGWLSSRTGWRLRSLYQGCADHPPSSDPALARFWGLQDIQACAWGHWGLASGNEPGHTPASLLQRKEEVALRVTGRRCLGEEAGP